MENKAVLADVVLLIYATAPLLDVQRYYTNT